MSIPAESDVFGRVNAVSDVERRWLEWHGEILRKTATLANEGKLKPPLNPERFTTADLDKAYAAVEPGSMGKVVLDIQSQP